MKRKSLFEDENSSYQQLVNATSESSKRKSLFEDEDSSYSLLVAGENIKDWEAYSKKAYDDYVKKNPNSTLENDEKRKELYNNYKEASDYLRDYDAYLEQRKLYSMSSGEIDSIISDYDSQIKSLKDEGGFVSAILPGGITPSDYKANKDKIKQLENEAAKYKTRRDYIKAQEVTSSLPADVIQKLDSYNNLLYSDEGVDNAQVAFSFMGAGAEGGGGNRVQYSSNEAARNKIIKSLTDMGYDNYVELAEYRKYITDNEAMQKRTQEWSDFTKEHPIASSTINLMLAPSRMVTSAVGSLDGLDNTTDLGLNTNSPYYALTHANRAKQKVISDSFTDGILSAEAKTFLYNTAESGVESLLAGVTFGPGGGALLGLGAYGDTVLSTVEKGGSYEDALFSGILAGTFEGLFESFSIGRLKAFKDVPISSVKAVLKNVGSGIIVNASEETLTEIANVISDYMINGGVSDYYNAVVAYMDEGMSESEAKSKAAIDMGARILEAGASGGLMGFGFGAGGSAMNYVSTAQNQYKSGKDIVKSGDTARLLLGASDVQWDGKGKNIYESVAEAQRKAEETEGYKYSGKEYYNVGRLSDKLNSATTTDRNSIVTKAVSERLSALGESGNIDLITSAIVKKSTGEKLSLKERSALKDSTYAQRVQNEMSDVLGAYSSEWTEQVKSDVTDLYERRYNPSESTQTKKYSDENYTNRIKDAVINEGQDKAEFDKQFELFEHYGRTGADFEQVKQTVPEGTGFTETQMKAAYDVGAELASKGKLDIVTGIDSVSGSDIYVATTSKGVQKLSDLNVEAATGNLVKSASKYGKETANAFIRGYNRSATVSSYETAFNAFYSAGAASSDVKYSEVLEKNKSLIKYMDSPDVAKKAFDLGRAERKKADASVVQKKQTGKYTAKGTYQSKTVSVGEEAIDEFYTAITKKLGLDIDRVQKIVDRKHEINAQYDSVNNKMTVSATAENELQASIHELVHAAFAYNTGKMKVVKKAVMDWFLSQHSATEFEAILGEYKNSYEGLTRAELEEEFIADAVGGLFTTEEGVQDFLNWLQDESGYNAAEKKTILQRITEWLGEIIDSIRSIMNTGELNGAGKLFAKQQSEALTDIRKQFLEALEGYGDNYRKGGVVEGKVRYSFSDKPKGNGKIIVESIKRNIDNISHEVKFDVKSEVLPEGIKKSDYVFNIFTEQGNIAKNKSLGVVELSKAGATATVFHGFGNEKLAAVRAIKNVIENGDIIEENINYENNGVDRIIIAAKGMINNSPSYVGVIVRRFYNKKTARNSFYLHEALIEKTDSPIMTGPQLSGDTVSESVSNNSISDSSENVKNQNKVYLAAVEKGNMETAQRMVEEAAKDKGYDSPVLYHGTHSFGFTNFDLDKMDDKRSIFLTNNKNIASTYSGVTGTKNIGDKSRDVSSLSAEDIVRELNEYDKQFKSGTTEGAHNYEFYDIKRTNKLINSVNDGIEALKVTVNEKIKEYAARMAVDFDDKDAKIHRQLVALSEKLQKYDYDNLSTPIYLLLHHTDVFGRSKEIGELEKNIRLMRQLRSLDTSSGVIVDEALGGYVIEVMSVEEARDHLEMRLKQGNYSLYAKLGKSLIIDGKGARWNDIRHWTKNVELKVSDVSVVKNGEFYELIDNETNQVLEDGSMAVNKHTDEMFTMYKDHLKALMVNKANQILHITTESMYTTREISKFAKEHGYDSVVFNNILDNGGMNSEVGYDETADIYVIFDTNSVKSADAVTYDENGEVIPLSERFNDENSDIRYSKKVDISNSLDAQNKVYLDAVEKGDMEAAKRMVDNYAIEQGFEVDEDGVPDLLFHGTDSFGFTKIDLSKSDDSITFWATPNMGVAGSYYKGSNYRIREIGKEKVSPKGEKLQDSSSMEKIVNAAKPFSSELGQDFSKAKYVSEDKVMRKSRKSMNKAVAASEVVLSGSYSEDVKKIARNVITASEQGTYEAWAKAINQNRWQQYSEITGVKFYEIDLPDNFNVNKSDISRFTDVDPDVFRMMYHIGDVLDGLGLDDYANIKGETIDKSDILDSYNDFVSEKGIYGFYHKQDNPFIYDCSGVKWDKIATPEEAKGYFSKDTVTTRELAEWAFKNGYDAIKLDNVIDVGANATKEARKPATVWAFKNPESQLKSADPVTYDDNGNVVPLTERFNQKNDDIRYSKKVNLSNKSLTSGNGKGYNKRSTYDEFRTNGMQWAYNPSTKIGDTGYAFNSRSGKHCIIEATKKGEGFVVIKELTSSQWRKEYESIGKDESSLREHISAFASERGSGYSSSGSRYKGAEGGNVRFSSEEGLRGSSAGDMERSGENNQEIQDGEVKYSRSIDDNLKDLHRSTIDKVTELGKVTAQMQAHILRIGSNLTQRELSALKIQEIARKLKVDYASKLDIHDLSGRLTELYTLINEGGASYDVLRAHLDDIKERLLKESKYMKPDISEAAKERLREIRKTPVSINETQRAEILSMYGNMTNFRRYTGLQITKDGTPLEMRWSEWADMSGVFDPEISDADMPIRLGEIIDSLKNTYEDDSGYDLDSARDQLDADICAAYLEIPTVAELGNRFFEIEQELLSELKAQRELYTSTFNKTYALARKAAKNDFDRQLVNAKARMETRLQNIADTRIREKKRNRLIKTVKRLDRLLRTPGKGAPSAGTNKYGQDYVHLTNIPEGLKRTVIDFCSIFVDNDAGVFTGKYTDSDNVIRKKINELRKQYQNLKQSDAYIGTSVSDEMTEKLEKLHDIVGEKRLSQLTAAELDTVNEIADHLVAVINNEVEMWVNGKKTKVADVGSAALNELSKKDMKGYILAMKGIDKLNVMNLKPIYFFEKVGGTLETLWKDILGGQDKYVRNMQFAQQRFSEVSKKYHLQEWADDEAMTFETAQGHEISLTRGQALLIWATWKREGKAGKDSKHLFEGGIVYPDAVKKASEKGKKKLPEVLQKVYEDGTAHRIRVEDMLKIDKWLTDEQKKYADELVSFLSNDIGAWGNEISMQLYGVNKFNEKYYIPFNSAKNYLYKGMGEEGTKLLKSEGFTNETKWGAANPLVVDDFTDVVVKHIERMSMYNSMVIPLDNFSRVWNYQERANAEGNESMKDVKAAFETAWGKEYKAYVENFLRDVNGGVMNDSREFGDKWLSKFKKAAVMGSLSVMIQQPSAIVRAMSEVDVKYFVSSSFGQRKAAYEEAMKYAPVAVLKEIGGFDTVSGQSMADWMLKREYEGMDKLKAFFKDSQYRDDVLSYGPAWADRVTWAHIWLACKNEVRVKKSLTGEALLEATGERFTDVINKTQVYDSVLSRSDAMRSKSTYMKMTTAFMAEPTTQWNMYGSAVRDFKNGDKKKGALKIASVVGSQLLNAALVSIIYAARDDDEEETQLEKYVASMLGNFFDSLNPLTLVPFVKDVISLAQGYSVERNDMSIFSNVIDSIADLGNEDMLASEKIFGVAGSVTDVFGFPLKNIIRDGKALINTAKSLLSGEETTTGGMIAAIRDEMFPILKNLNLIKDEKAELLFDAFVNEKESLYAEYASRYKDGKAVKDALTTQIKERYVSGELSKTEAEELLGRLGYGSNDAYYKTREWDAPADDLGTDETDGEAYLTLEGMKENSSEDAGGVKYTYLHDAIASGDTAQIKKEAQDLYDRGAEKEKVRSSLTSKWKKAYLDAGPYEKVRIREYLYATGAYDSLAHLDEYLKRWRESEQK